MILFAASARLLSVLARIFSVTAHGYICASLLATIYPYENLQKHGCFCRTSCAYFRSSVTRLSVTYVGTLRSSSRFDLRLAKDLLRGQVACSFSITVSPKPSSKKLYTFFMICRGILSTAPRSQQSCSKRARNKAFFKVSLHIIIEVFCIKLLQNENCYVIL